MRRYQVFLSSTFSDLEAERLAVTQSILRMQRCIPAGMEMFPASGLRPWEVISPVIDMTDYFVLVIAGRYGSTDENGMSYTEREYEYAHTHGIPILAFLHSSPDDLPVKHSEQDPAARRRLDGFRDNVRSRHTIHSWTTAADLAHSVTTSLYQAFDAQPRPGWVRGDSDQASRSSDSAPVVALDGIAEMLTVLDQPGGTYRIEREMRAAVDRVGATKALVADASVDGSAEVLADHASRVEHLEADAARLLRWTAALARSGRPDTDRIWLQLIPELSRGPRRSGSASLPDLSRAPGVLVFHAAGLGACLGTRDDAAAPLLGTVCEVDDPHRYEEGPAVALLVPELLYAGKWPSKQLYDYLLPLLEDGGPGPESLLLAWERWHYLAGVARTYLREAGHRVEATQPYLRIQDAGIGNRVSVGQTIRKQVAQQGDKHPLLAGGLCGGSATSFDAAARAFESNYGVWAERQDWRALPRGGGALPTGPHFPGEAGT